MDLNKRYWKLTIEEHAVEVRGIFMKSYWVGFEYSDGTRQDVMNALGLRIRGVEPVFVYVFCIDDDYLNWLHLGTLPESDENIHESLPTVNEYIEKFQAILDNPTEPNDKLKEAMKKYRENK